MLCVECMLMGIRKQAVALCPCCSIGICREHLVALFRHSAGGPVADCCHRPFLARRVRESAAPIAAGA